MASTWSLHVLLALVPMVQVTVAQTGEEFKMLHNELFNKRSYQKTILPRTRKQQALFISIEFYLRGIIYLDEIEEKLTTAGFMRLEWNDTFLSWDRRDFSNISYMYMPQNDVWKPDVSLYNGFTKLRELGDDVILVKIHSNGLVAWKPFEVFETKCDIDITKFPFDQQICKLVFRMWTSDEQDLRFRLKDSAVKNWSYKPNGVWDLISSTIELDKGNVVVTLTLDRRPQYHMLTLVCPIILLSLLAIFTFVIPVDSGEKIGYSMTVYLAFAVLLTIFSSSLPINSRTTSYLAVYLVSLLVMGTIIVTVTAVQFRLHRRPTNVDLPASLRRVIKISRKMFGCSGRRVGSNKVNTTQITTCKSEKSDYSSFPELIEMDKCSDTVLTLDTSNDYEDKEDEIFTWADFSAALDCFFFCLFATVAVVLTIVFLTLAL